MHPKHSKNLMTKESSRRSFFRRDDVEATRNRAEATNNTDSFERSDRPERAPRSERPERRATSSEGRPFSKFRHDKPAAPRSGGGGRTSNYGKPYRKSESDKPYRKNEAFDQDSFRGDAQSYNSRVARPEKPIKSTKHTSKGRSSAPVKLENLNEPVRLNRFIAQSGICSRREADELIANGEVTVNGVVITELGSKVMRTDKVVLDGRELKGEKKVYIILNKPKGYVTSLDDPHNDRTVIDLLKGEVSQRVYPVGRLDKNTTGVLLLTNDGDLTKELTHPSYEKRKIYHVFLDKPCVEVDLVRLAEGVELEDGMVMADQVSFVEGGTRKEVGVELHSGRNRVVRRMFEFLGYEVERLDRVYFAGMTKVGLRRGFWRYLTDREVAQLRSGNYQ